MLIHSLVFFLQLLGEGGKAKPNSAFPPIVFLSAKVNGKGCVAPALSACLYGKPRTTAFKSSHVKYFFFDRHSALFKGTIPSKGSCSKLGEKPHEALKCFSFQLTDTDTLP